MRQLDADLRRFFARRMVKGALLLVVGVILVALTISTVKGRQPSAEQFRRYQEQQEMFRTPQTFEELPPDAIDGPAPPVDEYPIVPYMEEPKDTRLNVYERFPTAVEGTGIAMLFVAFVLGPSFIGAEHNVGSLTTQLLYEPRRLRVHGSKALAAAFGAAAIAFLCFEVLALAFLIGGHINGITSDLDGAWWWHRLLQTLRITGAVALAGAMAYGVTLVARRTAAGVIVFFLQYPLMFLINPRRGNFAFVSKYLPLRGLIAIVMDPIRIQDTNLLITRTIAGGVALSLVWVTLILLVSGRMFARAEIR